MSNNDKSSDRAKYIQPIIIAVSVAVISAAGGSIYRHESMILEQKAEVSVLKKRLYRSRMTSFEYHDRYVRAEIQMLGLKKGKDGHLSVVDQTRMAFLTNLKETISENRTQAAEEGKDNG
jgi:hypothetical protein